ncbi:hypothetical protein DXG01_009964 [Tephrocybe rancida]|nr:hypothetical protein DXG01_009964 [Tephrocybe rancida]
MSSTNTGHIFNVPEAQGKEAVELETTAAEAQVEAPTAKIAREVEANAEHVQDAAHNAADAAKVGPYNPGHRYRSLTYGDQHKGPALTGAPLTASNKLQEQASAKTNAAVAEGQHDVEAAKAVGAGYVEQAKELVDKAIITAQSYLPASVGGEAGTTQEALNKAKGAVQGAFGTTGTAPTPASSTGIPATNS